MTEATCSLLGWDPTHEIDPNSVGELNANCHAKVMDPDGKTEVPTGERGEIWVQGPKCVSPSLNTFPPSLHVTLKIGKKKLMLMRMGWKSDERLLAQSPRHQ